MLFKQQVNAFDNRCKNLFRSFIFVSMGYVISSPFTPYLLSPLLKVTPIIILGVLIWSLTSGKVRYLATSALVFSGFGDVFLALDFKHHFIFGLASFLIAHLFYVAVFFLFRNAEIKLFKAAFIVIVVLFGIVTFNAINPYTGEFSGAVMVYMIVIILTCISATMAARLKHGFLPVGMLIFIISDTLIAWNKFVFPIWLSDVWIMLTYYLAQLIIAYGLIISVTNDRQLS